MADNNGGGATGILGVLIGALLVVGIGYFVFVGSGAKPGPTTSVTIEAPKAPAAPAAK